MRSVGDVVEPGDAVAADEADADLCDAHTGGARSLMVVLWARSSPRTWRPVSALVWIVSISVPF